MIDDDRGRGGPLRTLACFAHRAALIIVHFPELGKGKVIFLEDARLNRMRRDVRGGRFSGRLRLLGLVGLRLVGRGWRHGVVAELR